VGKRKLPPVTTPAITLSPARFELSELTVRPQNVRPGEAIVVAIKVSNSGETKGDYGVTLKINGIVQAMKTVSLAGGESSIVEFTVKNDSPGYYEVDVNGSKVSFTVQPEEQTIVPGEDPGGPPPEDHRSNWWIIGSILAVVIAFGITLAVVLVRSRKRATS
jgi:hypothetical protein